ncbi:MAG: hypothetical protein FIA99_03775 [Ruminiclostridium sp.]|nr:hypothetical protein [Ruminiclostridium sp.]
MLTNSYFFEKMVQFNKMEIDKQSKDWWKYEKAKNGSTKKNLFSLVLNIFKSKNNDEICFCCCNS